MLKQILKQSITTSIVIVLALSNITKVAIVITAEDLQSENYVIESLTIDSAGETLTSDSYSMLTALGEIEADSRLTSGSYEIQSGFPNGVTANIPSVRCFETNTDNTNTNCLFFPLNDGAVGECGEPGCFDRAKIEIDPQDNPYDTLYLVKFQALTDNSIFYLKGDHTLGSTYDASNFMTICELTGVDPNNPNCDSSEDVDWNPNLQSTNVYNLQSDTEYTLSALALNGDFTATNFSSTINATTVSPSIVFDIDIAEQSQPDLETTSPYTISLGEISFKFPTIATDLIWFTMGTNLTEGIGVYVRDSNNGLYSTSKTASIPSETEDLSQDINENGGFGIKTFNYNPSENSLGPLQKSSLYNTEAVNAVGLLSTTNNLLFYTTTAEATKGQINSGKAAIQIQAKAAYDTPVSGDYSTFITAVIIGNY